MSASIDLDRQRLLYDDGQHQLALPVQWAGVAKTLDHPVDVEINAGGVTSWTNPPGVPIPPTTWEQILDEIAARFSTGPQADIIGNEGALLRGVSKYLFYLNPYPHPSRYYEIGHYLAIPMVKTDKSARPRTVLDVSSITAWTSPNEPLSQDKRDEIIARARKEHPQIGVRE